MVLHVKERLPVIASLLKQPGRTLSELEEELLLPQPMVTQTRSVLEAYAEAACGVTPALRAAIAAQLVES